MAFGINPLRKNSNLSDLPNAATARTNLGLGDAATKNVNVANGVAGLNGDAAIVGPIQLRYGSNAARLNITLLTGEAFWTTDTGRLYIGDGSTAGGIAHTHAIADVTDLQSTLDGKASAAHTHTIGNVTDLQTTLDAKALASDLTTHTGNTSNPHSTTAAQVGALPLTGGTLTGTTAVGSGADQTFLANPTTHTVRIGTGNSDVYLTTRKQDITILGATATLPVLTGNYLYDGSPLAGGFVMPSIYLADTESLGSLPQMAYIYTGVLGSWTFTGLTLLASHPVLITDADPAGISPEDGQCALIADASNNRLYIKFNIGGVVKTASISVT